MIHNIAADGFDSMETKLRRLSTVGDVTVQRFLSKILIQNSKFQVTAGSNIIMVVSASDLTSTINICDTIFISSEKLIISQVKNSTFTIESIFCSRFIICLYL